MTKEDKTAVVPKLRFPEFHSAPGWQTAPLEKIAERVSTKNSDGEVTRVLTNSAEYGVLDQRDYFDRDIATAGKVDGYYIVDVGDYVYNPRTSVTAPVGPISRNNVGKGVMSPLYTVFRFAAEKTDFYKHFFKSTRWHSYVQSAASTGARHDRMSITTGAFMQMPVPTPNEAEQKKISDCLNALDELIAAQGRKVEALKTYKRGLIQQLFPREGEALPRLRFPEFRDFGQWEPYELGPFLVEYIERVPSGTALPIYSSTRTGLKLQKDYYDNRELANDGEYGVVPENLFVYRHMSDDGTFKFNINRTGSRIAVSKEYPVFAVEGMHPQFLFYLLNEGHEFKKFALAQKKGGTRTRLYLGVLRLCCVLLPSYEEQRRISNCLSSIDNQVSSEAAKLEGLETHRNGLMQQLFPSLE